MDGAPAHIKPTSRRRTATLLSVGAVVLVGVAAAAYAARSGTGNLVDASGAPSSTVPVSTTKTGERGPLGSGEAVTIAFAGDMYFEGSLRARLDADPSTAVGPFADVLRSADLAVGNLETALAVGGRRVDKQYAYRAPPSAVTALRAGGFDVVSMANNHGLDYGPDGFAESLATARAQADHFVIGIGGDEDEAFRPFTATVKGQRIAVIGATQVLDDKLIPAWTATVDQGGLASAKRVDRLVVEVQRARATSDTVVVYLHWGVELETCPSETQQGLAAALVAAGAEVIVGGHAHRLQGGGRLGDAVVHYGLGNFLFHASSPGSASTGVFEVTVTGRRVDGYRWVPGRIADGVPRPLAGAEADAGRADWEGLRACAGLTP